MSNRLEGEFHFRPEGEHFRDVIGLGMRHGEDTSPQFVPAMPYVDFMAGLTRQDTELSPHGRDEVTAALVLLGPDLYGRIESIITSPLLRARQTGEIVRDFMAEKTGRVVSVGTNDLLRELSFSDLISGDEYKDFLRRYGQGGTLAALYEVYNRWAHGQSVQEKPIQAYFRTGQFLRELAERDMLSGGNKIAFFISHGWLLRVLKHRARGGIASDPSLIMQEVFDRDGMRHAEIFGVKQKSIDEEEKFEIIENGVS